MKKIKRKIPRTVQYATLMFSFYIAAFLAFGQTEQVMPEEKQHPICPVMFSAGPDASICNDDIFVTRGFNKTPVLSIWQSSGDGFFENSEDPTTTYTPGEQDIVNGNVILTLRLFPMGGGGSEPIQDSMTLYLGDCETSNQL